jgi:ribosomal-protein-alanine N-acetyltransferase
MSVGLETERLRLRPWRESDLAPLAGFMTSEASRFVGGPMNEADSWRRIAMFIGHWRMRGFGPWALEEKSSGKPAGYAGLWQPHGWTEPEVMYILYDGFRGQGLATEAARRCRDHAFQDLGWKTAVSYILPANNRSKRVAERLGARHEGTANLIFAAGDWKHPEVWRHVSPQPTPSARSRT